MMLKPTDKIDALALFSREVKFKPTARNLTRLFVALGQLNGGIKASLHFPSLVCLHVRLLGRDADKLWERFAELCPPGDFAVTPLSCTVRVNGVKGN